MIFSGFYGIKFGNPAFVILRPAAKSSAGRFFLFWGKCLHHAGKVCLGTDFQARR